MIKGIKHVDAACDKTKPPNIYENPGKMAELAQREALRCRLCRAEFTDRESFSRHNCPVLGALRSQRYEVVRLGSERLLVRRRRPFGSAGTGSAAKPKGSKSIRRHPVLYSLLAMSALLFALGALADRGGFGAAPPAGPDPQADLFSPPAPAAPPVLPAGNPPEGVSLMDLSTLPEAENGHILILRVGPDKQLEYLMAMPAPPTPAEEPAPLLTTLDL